MMLRFKGHLCQNHNGMALLRLLIKQIPQIDFFLNLPLKYGERKKTISFSNLVENKEDILQT